VVAGMVIAWALRMLVACIALWSPGIQLDIFFSSLWQLGRYPVDVYVPWLRGLLTYLVPVGFVSSFPAAALTRGADIGVLMGGILVAALSVATVAVIWQAGLRRYTGATS
jgi:ABC-type uncharacterized transport system permease subunit